MWTAPWRRPNAVIGAAALTYTRLATAIWPRYPLYVVIGDPTVMLDSAVEEDTVEEDAVAAGEAGVKRPASRGQRREAGSRLCWF